LPSNSHKINTPSSALLLLLKNAPLTFQKARS
jgi:hypothetical protein